MISGQTEINRRRFLALAGIGMLSAGQCLPRCFAVQSKPAVSRPNIVLVMADDQGWGEVGYNGHPQVKTPVLDSMARAGLQLERFYAGACVCSPTRASVLTGRNPNRSGVFSFNYSIRPEEITIAQVLKNAGYRTGHFGKWHVGAVKAGSPTNPARMGFDEYLAHDNFFDLDPLLSRNGAPPEVHKGEGSMVAANAACEFVKKVKKEDKPFFVVIWFGSPHFPYHGLPEDLVRYKDVKKVNVRNRLAEITAMDRALGRFRDELKSLGVADNTLLWYTSDNGISPDVVKDSFAGGWHGSKDTIYEGGLRVPAIIEWPAVIKSHRKSAVPCVSSDIFPTLLDLTGTRSPDPSRPLDGISLRELILHDGMKERPSPIGFWRYDARPELKNPSYMDVESMRGTARVFVNYRHPVARSADFGGDAAWTDNRFKLVVLDQNRKSTMELYDLLADPKETRNIAGQHPDIVKRMAAQLHDWQQSVERSLSGADYT